MKLADITPAPWNARKITPESVAELAASIREQGLLQPIIVWRDKAGQCLCIAGNRRLAAMRSIGYALEDGDTVEFAGDEAEARQITITENLQREDLGVIEEAAAVTALLDLGAKVETVAAKIGKSTGWVRRRAKLAALDEAWKNRAGDVDADALERIAAYPADIQQRVAKVTSTYQTNWGSLGVYFDRESKDLDTAKFATDGCRECLKRTGVEADLFGVADGKLGRCLDCKCFEKKRKEHEDAEIERLVGDAEVVRVKYAWQMPDRDKSEEKRSKKYPCAYVFADGYNGVEVRWGESAKAKKARGEAYAKAKADEQAEGEADRKRAVKITDKLKEAVEIQADEIPSEVVRIVSKFLAKNAPQETVEYIIDKIAGDFDSWHDEGEWVRIIEAFPALLDAAGIGADDAEWFKEYAERD